MPDTQQMLQHYALALALVPDETEAGDIFMAARDEDHLCHLAAQWRERHGLPYMANPPSTPVLTEDQKAYGLHLLRRRERRRRSRQGLAAAAAAVLLVVGAIALGRVPVPGMTSSGDRQAQSSQPGSAQSGQWTRSIVAPTLEVTGNEATPGSVTVWWRYTGELGDVPVLVIGDSTIMPDSVESRREGSGVWIEGSSTYTVITAGKRIARLEARQLKTNELVLGSEPFDLTWVSDPAARVVRQEAPLKDSWQGLLGTVDQVVLGTNYTVLRYRPARAAANANSLEVTVDGVALQSYGELAPLRYLTDGQELVFGPVPEGARRLEITPRGWEGGMNFGVPVTPDVVTWNGSEVRVVVDFPITPDGPWELAELASDGGAYEATVQEIDRTEFVVTYEFTSDRVPPGTVLRYAQLRWGSQQHGPTVTIDLL